LEAVLSPEEVAAEAARLAAEAEAETEESDQDGA